MSVKRMHIVTLVLLFCLLTTTVVTISAQAPGFGTKQGSPKVAVVVKTLTGDVFQVKMAEAARDEAKRLGGQAEIYQAGGQTAVAQMVSIIEDLIQNASQRKFLLAI